MTTTAKKLELKPEVQAMSDKLTEGFVIDVNAKTVTTKDGLYESTLPEGLTIDIVKNVQDHNSTFVAAGAHAFGKLAVDAMKANKGLDKLTVDITMCGKDSVSYTVDREQERINHLGGGETIHKFGVITTTLDVRAGKNGGQLKVARSLIGEMAMASLKK